MPQSQFQRMMFALLTVIITVHAYVFYSLYMINGSTFLAITGAHSVLSAIREMGGVAVWGKPVPIWGVVLIEFLFAYTLENVLGSPLSFKLVCRHFDPRSTHPVLFETAIISATVAIMCPSMSLIAAWIYYPYNQMPFNIFTFLANWGKLVCFNFPFALLSQLFFIQPLVRTLFRAIFVRKRAAEAA